MYYIKENNPEGKNAGTKARNDVEKILKKHNYHEILGPKIGKELPHGNRINLFFRVLSFWNKVKKIPTNSWIFIQYPLMVKFTNSLNRMNYSYLFSKIANRFKTIVLIHDLADIRGDTNRSSIRDLKKANIIISHNEQMTNFLVSKGIDKSKILNLKLFDYLITSENVSDHFDDTGLVCFAGNLKKSTFIYDIPDNICKFGFNLYGLGYKKNKKEGLNYKGAFDSEEISSIIRGKFGLIWDGTSCDTCTGIVGNYLKYNNPHKLSMYIAANMPVIIWKNAAEAKFVKEQKIGILISSMDDIELISSIKKEDYDQLVQNVKRVKHDVISGSFLEKNLSIIENKIKRDETKND